MQLYFIKKSNNLFKKMKVIKQLLISLLLLITTVINAQDHAIQPRIVGHGVFLGETPPLRNLPSLTPEEVEFMKDKAFKKAARKVIKPREYPFAATALPKGSDAIWQKTMGETSLSKAPLINFEGQTTSSFPPDCNGTVGPNHYMQTVNTTYAIYNKSGTLLAGPTNMNLLFNGVSGTSCNDGDPLVQYDEQAQRWIAVEFSLCGTNDLMLVAVSSSSDPTGSWYAYSFDVADTPDYEKIGVWQDGYYMGTNTGSGNDIYVFERSQMLIGGASPKMVAFDNAWRPSTGFLCVPPLDNDGAFAPAGTPGLFIAFNDDAVGGGSDQLWIYELAVNWTTPANSTFVRSQQIAVTAFDSQFDTNWDDITQPGTQKLDGVPQVIMNAPQYRNFGTYQTIVCCHTVDVNGSNQAGIRWYELRKTTGSWSVRQSGTYAPDANSRWMGSIMLNGSGKIGLAYSIASSSVYPGIRYCGQSASAYTNATGIMDIPEEIIQTGTVSQTTYNRWGDYALLSVDPTDDQTFWFTSEYVKSGGTLKGTKIASFRFGNNPLVTTTAATSVTATTATLNGTVNPNGLSTTYYFQWGTSTSYGNTTTSTSAGSATSTFPVTANITGLISGTPYHFRLVAVNSDGTTNGNDFTFTTGAASVTTTAVSSITSTTAVSGGNVLSDGGLSVTARGVCWNTSPNPTIANSKTTDGNGTGSFSSSISALSANTPYFLRAYATNSAGTFYGDEITFTTSCGTITTFPYLESFATSTIPACYTFQNTGVGITNLWTASSTSNAGGTAYEMKATWQNINPGTSRMILTPINTLNITQLNLNFKHFFDDYGSGCNLKIQTSTNLSTWTDAGWIYSSGVGNIGPATVNLSITQNLNNATTYIAFVLDGNLYQLDYWFIDDITITSVQSVTASMSVSATTLPSFGNVNQNYSSSRQYFGVSGSGLTGNITVTAPAGFLLAKNCNDTFSSGISISPVSGNVPYTRIWVKYNPSVLGNSAGNITVATAGVTSKTIAVSGTCISSAIPSNYYITATGSGASLKTQLHNIIKVHTKRSYTNLWTDFQTTDKKYNGKVWDMYSDKPCDSNYEFTFITNQCGTYTTEGGCYNREHSLPNSWWGGSTTDSMYSDLNTLVPTDGYVNNMRSNYTFGKVTTPSWTSTNGSKRGPCSYPGYTGTQANVFEPIDEYKGDFARIFLYMATRYESRVASWITDGNANDCFNGTTFPAFETWQINLLMEWHNNDPVSQKEINRNNAVYSIQGNRNPFIDYPEYVALIWQSTPLVNTYPATNIMATTVTCNGTILSQGSSPITESGIIYSLTPNPVIGGAGVIKINTSPLISTGNYSLNINGLIPSATYYARAFAINTIGTTYGNDIMFNTEDGLPLISTDSVINITSNSAQVHCNVLYNNYTPIQFTGVVYSTMPNPLAGNPNVTTASTNPLDTTGVYTMNLINLLPATTYYVRAYSSNGIGEAYGNETIFNTLSCVALSIPYTQDFESAFPPIGWTLYNPDAGKTWQNKYTGGSKSGDSSAYINYYSYSASPQTDDLISPSFDLVGATNPKLFFKVAYRYYSTSSTDSLRIYYSTDCGNTYNSIPIYNKGGAELSTGGSSLTAFTPTVSSDWRDEVINLNYLIGNSVKFKFQAVNDYGNNLYIDDIYLSANGLMPPTAFTYPATVLNSDTVILYGKVNPNNSTTNVQFEYGSTTSYGTIINAFPSIISGDTDLNVYAYVVGLPVSSSFNYRVVASNSMGISNGNNVTFNTPCATFNLPVIENFDNPSRPNCWTVQNTSGLTDKWTISATTNAGGSAYELKSTYQLLNGTTRFVSPPFNSTGKSILKLTFKQFFDDYLTSTATNFKIQTSTDAINWTDENYSFTSGIGNFGPVETAVSIYNNLNSPSTYLAFVISDSLGKYDYWYIDDIKIEDYLPVANFSTNKIYSCLNDSVTFTNTSYGTGITSYLWNFGNGAIPQTAIGVGPHTVKYISSGLKTISLTLNGQYITTKTNYINVQENSAGGYISGNGSICINNSTGTMVLTNYNGNILKWEKRYNSGSWIDIANTSASYSEILSIAGNWEYRALVGNTGCNTSYSDIFTIVVSQNPIAGNIIALPSSICSGESSLLTLDSYVGNIQWQQSPDGINDWTTINGSNSQILNTSPLFSMNYFRVVTSNGSCAATYSNIVSVSILPSPVSGIASATQNSFCSGGSTNITLSNYSGTIQWEESPDSLIWNNVTAGSGSTSAIYSTAILNQTNFYRAKVSIANCISYSNAVKINVFPTAVGGNLSVIGSPMCGGNYATLTLANSVGLIQWIQSSTGTGNWTDVTTGSGYNTNVYITAPLSVSTYFRARLSSGNCPVVYSPISNVIVYPQVLGGTATANTNICIGNSTTISLNGSYGNIVWQQTFDTTAIWTNAVGGVGNTTSNYTTPNLTTPIFYRAKLSGNLCPDAFSNIISININNPSLSGEVTAVQTVLCEGSSATLNVNGYLGNIQWQQSSNGIDNWTDVISGIGYNSSFFTTDALNTNVFYRSKVTNGGCPSDYSAALGISIDLMPVAGNISPLNQTICIGNNATVSIVNSIGNIQWQQSDDGTNGWVNVTNGSGANSNIYITSSLISDKYFRVILSNGSCPSVISAVASVIVAPLSNGGIATVGNTNFCSGGSSSLSLTGYSGSIQWEQSNDSIVWGNVTTGSGSTSANYTTSALSQTTFYRARLLLGSCINYSNIVKINVYPIAIGGTISVTGSPMCSGNSATLTLNGSIGDIQWIQSATGTGNWTNVIIGNGINSPVFNTSTLSSTTYYRAKLTSGSCPVVYSPISNIVVYSQAVGGVATALNADICTGSNTSVSLTGQSGSIVWEQSNDSLLWSAVIGGSGSNSSTYTTPVLNQFRFYRARLSNGICPLAYSTVVKINVSSQSIAGIALLAEESLCQGNTADLTLSNNNGNIQWQQSIDGSSNWIDITNGTGFNSNIFITETLTESWFFRAKVTNGGCTSVYSNIESVHIDNLPVAGNISALDDSICNTSMASLDLVNQTGNIQWQSSLDGIGNWIDLANGNGQNYSQILTNSTYFRTKITNGVCPEVYSTIDSVFVKNQGIGGAVSGSKSVCLGSSTGILMLNNSSGNISKWQKSFDSGGWIDILNIDTIYSEIPDSAGSWMYRAVIEDYPCLPIYAEAATIQVYDIPVGGIVTGSKSICLGYSTDTLIAENYHTQIVKWQKRLNDGNWSDIDNINKKFIDTPVESGKWEYRIAVTNGICDTLYSSVAIISVNPLPIINAGSDVSVCKGDSITLYASGGNSYQWSHNVLQGISFIPDSTAVYFVIGTDTNNCSNSDTISIIFKSKILQLKVFLQGLYAGNGLMNNAMNEINTQWGNLYADKLNLELRDTLYPYEIIDTFSILLPVSGIAVTEIPCTDNSMYYMVIRTRNHLETWSSEPISFENDTISYDFSDAKSKAYGENQKQIAQGLFAILVGDVNQDGVVDITDLVDMDSDIINGVIGYVVYDLNGDGIVDLSDLVVIDENLTNGAIVIAP